MPQDINLNVSNPGIDPNIQSVRVWLFPGPGFAYPPAGTDMPSPLPQVEVSASQAHFLIYEGFDGKSARGTSLGRGSIDTGDETVMAAFQATTVEELLINAFPAPLPD